MKDYTGFIQIINSATGLHLVPEVRFFPPRRWRFDFADVSKKIAIEVEGGVWSQGRHTRPRGYIGDMEKYNTAAATGWRVFRFTPGDILKFIDLYQSIKGEECQKE